MIKQFLPLLDCLKSSFPPECVPTQDMEMPHLNMCVNCILKQLQRINFKNNNERKKIIIVVINTFQLAQG